MGDVSFDKKFNQSRFLNLEKRVDCKFEDIPEREVYLIHAIEDSLFHTWDL